MLLRIRSTARDWSYGCCRVAPAIEASASKVTAGEHSSSIEMGSPAGASCVPIEVQLTGAPEVGVSVAVC